MAFFTKDIHEKLDYVIVYDRDDPITSVTYTQSANATITVNSCAVSVNTITDSSGNTYPAGQAVILWVQGGDVGSIESVRVEFTTTAGRVLDEEITFSCVEVG